MDVFQVHERLIADYDRFTTSLVHVRDERVARHLKDEQEARVRWPHPWVSLNPSFAGGGTISELVTAEMLHPMCEQLFRIKTDGNDPGSRPLSLHRHQREAVEIARDGGSYVLTTGTGSGKSLSYMVPIVDSILRDPEPGRVKAIVVYPMNALANSQLHELERFLEWGLPKDARPVSFERYTGQEDLEKRSRILARKPDILLTNYVMLEYLLTRPEERRNLIGAAQGLRFLVLDELHTYRGRQGADVALLVRRLRDACDAPNLQCVGTSATMATGSSFERTREVVAGVATRLFGTEVTADRVIGETLVRATRDGVPTPAELVASMATAGGDRSYQELADDPLATWIESEFGLETEPESTRLTRRHPAKVADVAEELHAITGQEREECTAAIERLLQEGARAPHPETGRPLFAFRLHQFLSKGDTTYVSLEPEDVRYITSQYQVSVPGQREKILLPQAFCRECGQDYLVVAREKGGRYSARQEANVAGGDAVNGYLYLSTGHPWPADPVGEGRLPDSWLEPDADGRTQVRPSLGDRLPREVWLGPGGSEVSAGEGIQAWYLPSPFRFCLRCRAAYEQTRGRDFAKLATFATEGRSSAVSIISTSVVRSLREQNEKGQLDDEARKVLTFVDNRQDASLQAGHLNDFVQVTQLRGALYRAARAAGEEGLRHDEVAQRVARAMELPLAAFAQNPEVKFGQKEAVLKALRGVLSYLIYLDLERGWRITMPNLEQTGLLRFDYVALDDIAADTEHWERTHPALRTGDPAHRADLARIVLDEMRRALAVEVEELTPEGYERIQKQSGQNLTGVWALPEGGGRDSARMVFARPGRPGESRDRVNFTGRSALGNYLRRAGMFPNHPHRLTVDDAQEIIVDLLWALEKYGLLTEVQEGRDGAKGYRLKSSELIWRAGNGRTGAPDPLRKTVDPEVGTRISEFFKDLYAEVATRFAGIHAAEHTAQVRAQDRQEREQLFREGTLPLLYCSPTMELGVDIATLNTVAMRNVPPTPANYAQRSGRAGRSGQPALITTYCSTGSSHDQYYFRRSHLMVAGSVQPPRLDLTNEDLVLSHVHAIWLAETGADLHSQMTEVLDIAEPGTLPVRKNLRLQLADDHAVRRAIPRARRMLDTIVKTENLEQTTWWDENWVERKVRGAAERFDAACGRWRDLYRAAIAEQAEQNRRVLDHASTPDARKRAQGRRMQAENQIRLLKNEDTEQQFSDFYTYRYFASEGFLPGYSFPRLPLAAYIPGRKQRGSYVQRPRFIAIGEFGPGALIYHEGQRYQVASIQVPAGESGDVATAEARICAGCGYWHTREAGVDNCEECAAELGGSLAGLMHLQTVHTVRRERISSDEEERRRAGFELVTSYRFSTHGTRSGRLQADVRGVGESLAELVYGDTATVRVINKGGKGRRNRNDVGFWLDPIRGRWLSETKATERTPEDQGLTSTEEAQRVLKVVPFVEDRKNICVIRLAGQVSETVATTLRYALERGIEAEFQLEDAELTSEPLPDPAGRGRMLFIESAEGGAGVLRRLHDEPEALRQVARRALEIIHIDPDTGEDLDHAPDAKERCERGCYDCLLSYGNQLWHTTIDRLAVVDLLRELAASTTERSGGHASVEDHLDALSDSAGSELERRFVGFLREGDYRLPDGAQELLSDARAKPDFVYRTKAGNVAVFVDGPHHDDAYVTERDMRAEDRLMDLGWLVIRFRHDEEWGEIVRRYPSVFGTGRGTR